MPNATVPAAATGLPIHHLPSDRRSRRRALPQPLARPRIVFLDLASIPAVYAMQLAGTCLEPDLMDGDEVQFARDEPIKVGDFCIFILRPEFVMKGPQSMIKRLTMGLPPYVTLPWTDNPKSDVHALVMAEQLNPRRQYMIKCDRLLAIHKFVGVQGRRS